MHTYTSSCRFAYLRLKALQIQEIKKSDRRARAMRSARVFMQMNFYAIL